MPLSVRFPFGALTSRIRKLAATPTSAVPLPLMVIAVVTTGSALAPVGDNVPLLAIVKSKLQFAARSMVPPPAEFSVLMAAMRPVGPPPGPPQCTKTGSDEAPAEATGAATISTPPPTSAKALAPIEMRFQIFIMFPFALGTVCHQVAPWYDAIR